MPKVGECLSSRINVSSLLGPHSSQVENSTQKEEMRGKRTKGEIREIKKTESAPGTFRGGMLMKPAGEADAESGRASSSHRTSR